MSEDTDADDGSSHGGDSTRPSADDRDPSEPTEKRDSSVGDDAEEFDAPTSDEPAEDPVEGTADAAGRSIDGQGRGPKTHELLSEIRELEDRLESFESDVEGRTVSRDEVERDLRRYVRRRMRRGHARGWGPYLVLLYGTIMTLGAFYFLQGGWAVAAMVVIWLSTLGLYVLFVLFGAVLSVLNIPGRLYDRASEWRSR